MATVLASPRHVPELLEGLAARRRDGRHTGDDWVDGVVRLAGPATPEEGEATARLVAYLLPLAESLGLAIASPTAIGAPGRECRVPAVVVFDRATPRTAPDALSTADLVIELVRADGADLAFHTRWRVREHLAVDVESGALTLRRADADGWFVDTHSHVLGFDVVDDELVSLRGRLAI